MRVRPAAWLAGLSVILAGLLLVTASMHSGAQAPDTAPPPPPLVAAGFRGQTANAGAPSEGERTGALFDVLSERDTFDDSHRVTWDFGEGGTPSYRVGYTNAEPLAPGSGLPVEVAGDVYLRVDFSPAGRALLTGGEPVTTYDGPLRFRALDNPNIEEIVFVGDFEAEMVWYIGMKFPAGFDIETQAGPATLVLTLHDPVEGISNLPVLGVGSRGPNVLALEQTLRELDYLDREANTARFDEPLREAVTAFQEDEGIVPNGQVGPETWFRLVRPGILAAGPEIYVPGLTADGQLPTPTPSPTPVATVTPTPTPVPSRTIYLTFDDGPNPAWTPGILSLLAQYDAHATFFLIGEYAAKYPTIVKTAVEQGHHLGNHTFHHVDLTEVGIDRFFDEVHATQTMIAETTGITTQCLRPPYGATSQVVQDRAAELGLTTVLWDIDPQDWRRPGVSVIVDHVVDHAYPGAIVLMHDGGGDRSQTVAALDLILSQLSAEGYRFAALDC